MVSSGERDGLVGWTGHSSSGGCWSSALRTKTVSLDYQQESAPGRTVEYSVQSCPTGWVQLVQRGIVDAGRFPNSVPPSNSKPHPRHLLRMLLTTRSLVRQVPTLARLMSSSATPPPPSASDSSSSRPTTQIPPLSMEDSIRTKVSPPPSFPRIPSFSSITAFEHEG